MANNGTLFRYTIGSFDPETQLSMFATKLYVLILRNIESTTTFFSTIVKWLAREVDVDDSSILHIFDRGIKIFNMFYGREYPGLEIYELRVDYIITELARRIAIR